MLVDLFPLGAGMDLQSTDSLGIDAVVNFWCPGIELDIMPGVSLAGKEEVD